MAEEPGGRAQEHKAISERETRSPGGGKIKVTHFRCHVRRALESGRTEPRDKKFPR